jgi:hypothetical protein
MRVVAGGWNVGAVAGTSGPSISPSFSTPGGPGFMLPLERCIAKKKCVCLVRARDSATFGLSPPVDVGRSGDPSTRTVHDALICV